MEEQLSLNNYNKDNEIKGTKDNHKYKVVINHKDIEYKYFIDKDKAKDYLNKKKKELSNNINIGI